LIAKSILGTRRGGLRGLSSFKTRGCWVDTETDRQCFFRTFLKQKQTFHLCERRRLINNTGDFASENAVALGPAYMRHCTVPGDVMIPVADAGASWNLFIVRQRGQITQPLRALLNALPFPIRDIE